MKAQKTTVGLMFFSPTGTTRKVCEAVANSISPESQIRLDLTKPQTRGIQKVEKADVWVVGIPVYASRMPLLARERITQVIDLVPKKTPAIAIAVYGNVDAGAGLKQLVDLLSEKGLNVIGAGEFVGQHYFKEFHGLKAEGTEGRPNKEDLAVAAELGTTVLKKGLDRSSILSIAAIRSKKVPFRLKFSGEKRVLGLLGPSTVDSGKCTKCQACVKVCPVGCIDAQTLMGDALSKNCLGCGNCMRVCPNNARNQTIRMKWLVKRMAKPKNPPGKPIYYV
jgi:Pyruvate/2-oxoacid:ferredoxin oxidoreductase delta subunit/flavodoxin